MPFIFGIGCPRFWWNVSPVLASTTPSFIRASQYSPPRVNRCESPSGVSSTESRMTLVFFSSRASPARPAFSGVSAEETSCRPLFSVSFQPREDFQCRTLRLYRGRGSLCYAHSAAFYHNLPSGYPTDRHRCHNAVWRSRDPATAYCFRWLSNRIACQYCSFPTRLDKVRGWKRYRSAK